MTQIGYRGGVFHDAERLDWDGQGPRPLAWSAWYPAVGSEAPARHPEGGFFDFGKVVPDAGLQERASFPVVLLSHGTGGAPESLGWLAREIAGQGFVVIGAHHHGNTGREPYRAEGFLCWWERATDLSVLLTLMQEAGPFAGRLDLDRVYAVGFSLGAYTVLALAGARTSMDRYLSFAAETGLGLDGPREFPGVGEKVPHLLETSEGFRDSWDRQGADFADARVGRVVAIAPPPPVRAFDPETVAAIALPTLVLIGEADGEAPSIYCANWLADQNPRFRLRSLGDRVGHYTFVGLPADVVPPDLRFLFQDLPSVDRRKVHTTASAAILTHLS